jgi:hypothetical protein
MAQKVSEPYSLHWVDLKAFVFQGGKQPEREAHLRIVA